MLNFQKNFGFNFHGFLACLAISLLAAKDGMAETEATQIPIGAIRDAAGLCIPSEAKIDKPKEYVLAFAGALEQAKEAREELGNAITKNPDSALLYLKKAKQRFACAMLQIAEYRSSQLDGISTSAQGAVLVFNDLFAGVGAQEADFRDALDGKSRSPGAQADRIAEISLAIDSAWKRLALSGVASTYSLLDEKNQGALVITKKEKAEIIKRLEKVGGKKYKTDKHAIFVTVDTLVKFLNKKWKFAPQGKTTS